MSPLALVFVVVGLGLIGWLAAHARAAAWSRDGAVPALARPAQHGWYVAAWTALPALAVTLAWTATAPGIVSRQVLALPAARGLPAEPFERAVVLAEARRLGAGEQAVATDPRAAALAPSYRLRDGVARWLGIGLALLLALAGWRVASRRIAPAFPARRQVDRLAIVALLAAALVAIATTAGILASLVYESVRFFDAVPATDFLFGLHWAPQVIDPARPGATLGAVPLFWGTFLIGGVVALLVAVPLGLMSAIYLGYYAGAGARRWLKPLLELLAGVPTVVYGFFAALVVAPAVRQGAVALGDTRASGESALAAGLVMGMMIIPYVSSIADDSLAAVPDTLRDGSLALGATSAETIRRVLLPAAMPGIAGGVLLAFSRAVGETMIVLMAASGTATLSLDPFRGATTVTRQIVDLLTGEGMFDSPKTLAAFALGLTLFVVTLVLNGVALAIVRRFRASYE